MLHLDVSITVVLSIPIATSTMLNWLLEPRKRFMHLLLVPHTTSKAKVRHGTSRWHFEKAHNGALDRRIFLFLLWLCRHTCISATFRVLLDYVLAGQKLPASFSLATWKQVCCTHSSGWNADVGLDYLPVSCFARRDTNAGCDSATVAPAAVACKTTVIGKCQDLVSCYRTWEVSSLVASVWLLDGRSTASCVQNKSAYYILLYGYLQPCAAC